MIQAQISSHHREPKRRRKNYDQYVVAYAADLYHYGYWLCKDRDSTARLVTKTYHHAWLTIAHSGDATLSDKWFFSVLHNEFYAEPTAYESPEGLEPIGPAVNGTANDRLSRLDSLRKAIAKMPIEYRETLVLHDLFNLGCAEIGKICEISDAAVRTRLIQSKKNILSDSGQNREHDLNTLHNALQ